MKCPACGYTKAIETETVEEVSYFVSGPRKGEIKGTKKREITLQIGDEDFEQTEILTGLQGPSYYTNYDEPFTRNTLDFNSMRINICPKCGTLFKDLK